jgi:hypothetical protein
MTGSLFILISAELSFHVIVLNNNIIVNNSENSCEQSHVRN